MWVTMGMYCIGDIQGCATAFDDLLHALDFSPSRDTLYVLGDLVNRGPNSAGVLRRLMQLEGSVHCILGNHDIHALAVSLGLRQMGRRDTLTELLTAHDAISLIDWLRQQPLAHFDNNCLMVHAGVQPDWDVQTTLECASEVHEQLAGKHWRKFLTHIFGNEPAFWSPDLTGMARWRSIVNTLTRMRFLHVDGSMDFGFKRTLEETPDDLIPWFAHPLRRTADVTVAFGHWSALGLIVYPNLLGLDTGCVWGEMLTAAEVHPNGSPGRIVQVRNTAAAAPIM